MNTRILLLATSLSGSLPALAQPVVSGSFQFGGVQRDYRLYIPAAYNAADPVPLVFNLHGYTSNNLQQEFYGDFRPIADTAIFIIAHPNGTLDGSGNRFWNTFGSSSVDDLGFITALLDTISAQYNIDADRVYSTGMSNGGFMSHDLACFRSERFAAIASVTGSMITPRLNACAATHPMPVMQIHGTADGTVPYTGGGGFVPVATLVDHWADFNNCDPTPVITAVPNTSTTDGCTVEHHVYSGGDAGSSVELFKVLDGGHTWPGAIFNTGVTNQDINASVEIWRFFNRYRLSELQTGITAQQQAPAFSIAPNPSSSLFHLGFAEPTPRTVRVRNSTGQEVLLIRASTREVLLELEVPGVYLVSVEEGVKRTTQRIVKW